MGTIGGSLANNDPAADYPAAALALGATIVTNKRRIPAQDFFTGLFETALETGELITQVSFPIPQKAAYMKFPQPGVALCAGRRFRRQDGRRRSRRGDRRRPERRFSPSEFEAALNANFSPAALDGVSVPADGLNSDLHADADYRAHLIGVMARRAVRRRAEAQRSGEASAAPSGPGLTRP